jgi:peptide/nickel transport system substrate-binding protein
MAQKPDVADHRASLSQTRRHLLRAVGVAGLVGGAGCQTQSGSGPSDESPGSGGSSAGNTTTTEGAEQAGEPVDPVHTTNTHTIPKNSQFNPYNPKNGSAADTVLFDPFAVYDAVNESYVPYLYTDWNLEEGSLSLTLSEKHTWHDGTPITSADVVTQFRLQKYFNYSKWDYLDSVSADGEKGVKLSLSGTVNSDVLKRSILAGSLNQPESIFGDKLEKFESATTDSERDSVRQSLLDWTLPDPLGNGPFEIGERTQQSATLELYKDHPAADDINFPEMEFRYLAKNQTRWQAIIGDKVDSDSSVFAPAKVKQKFPDHFAEVKPVPNGGMTLTFNRDSDVFSDRHVRRAFAHVIDREAVTKNAGGSVKVPVEIINGISGIPLEKSMPWIDEIRDGFNPYEMDTEKASELLRKAGFRKRSGTWKRDGNPLSAPVKVPAGYSDWVSGGQTLVSHLKQFGIEAKMVTIETSSYWGDVWPNGNFEVAMSWWGGWNPYPYFSFRQSFTSQDARGAYSYPASVEVPLPPGEPDGETGTVNVRERVPELARTADEGTARGIVHELAWVYNQDLPKLPLTEKVDQVWLSTDDWQVPAPDADVMQVGRPTFWLLRAGKLRAKTK